MWVYAEEVVLLNAAMDAVLLAWTGRLEARRLHPLRLAAAACLGGTWAAVTLLHPLPAGPVGQLAMAALMVAVAWPRAGLRSLAEAYAAFWGLSFVGGGAAAALAGRGVHLWLLCALAAAALFLPGRWTVLPRRVRGMRRCLVPLLWHGTTLTGYADTGCTAVEPLSGLPVLVLSADWAVRHLPAPAGEGRLIPLTTVQGGSLVRGYRAEGLCCTDGTPLEAWYVVAGGPLAGHADILIPGCWERRECDDRGLAAKGAWCTWRL